MEEIDEALPDGGLALGGVHELRPESYRDHGATLGFALALIGRRLALVRYGQNSPSPLTPPYLSPACGGDGEELGMGGIPDRNSPRRPALKRRSLAGGARTAPLLWALTDAHAREHGRPYGPGLISFGIDPATLLVAQAANERDLAFALEEGIKSRALAAVLGQVGKAPPVFARRLALAARASGTPCLIVRGTRGSGIGPALTRWRIAAARSGPNLYDPAAPGLPCWRIALERCRWSAGGHTWTVEWSNDAYRFRLAAPMADRTPAAGEAGEPLLASAG